MKRKTPRTKISADIIFWKDQANYWKKRALLAESQLSPSSNFNSSLAQDVNFQVPQKIFLNQLPTEILWNIMEFLDYESCSNLSSVLDFDKHQAFKYHFFTLEESTIDFPFFCESIRTLIQNQESALDALLVNKRFRKIVEIEKVLALASNFGFKTVLCKLLSWKVDPSDDDNLSFRLACENGHYEIVQLLLLDSRIDPACCANYPILYASRNGHLEIVKLLLSDSRVDPSDVDNWAIKKAAYLGHFEIVFLLKKDDRVRSQTGFDKFWKKYLRSRI